MSANDKSSAESDRFTLRGDEIHVWRVMLDDQQRRLAELHALLSDDERQRAIRFHSAHNRMRFVVARAALRSILSTYLNTSAASIRFRYGDRGKPELHDENGVERPQFNLSHSRGTAVIAIARRRALGIDIEAKTSSVAHDRVAAQFFSAGEKDHLSSLPHEQRRAAFFAYWTLKEAYLKGRGEGVLGRLARFDVALTSSWEARLVTDRDDPMAAEHWSLIPLRVARGFASAIAIRGPLLSSTLRDWRPYDSGCGSERRFRVLAVLA